MLEAQSGELAMNSHHERLRSRADRANLISVIPEMKCSIGENAAK